MNHDVFGFIGTGNMGSALADAIAKKINPSSILLANRTPSKAMALAEKLGAVFSDNLSIGEKAKYIFLGVKPQGMAALLAELAPTLKSRDDRFILVTMAAGLSSDTIAAMCGSSVPVIRMMPNVPCSVGEGMILYTANALVSKEELTFFADALSFAGNSCYIEEKDMDAASVISGCGPAFMFMFLDAMSKAGVALGLDIDRARLYAEQTMLGAAKLALVSGEEPNDLKIKVCSPGGTTIEGVRCFENRELEQIVLEAMAASYKRTLELSGK